MALITSLLASFQKDEEGQGLAEYALILALIAIVAIVALIFLGGQVSHDPSTVGARSSHQLTEDAVRLKARRIRVRRPSRPCRGCHAKSTLYPRSWLTPAADTNYRSASPRPRS